MNSYCLLVVGLLGSLGQWLAVSRPVSRPAATEENYQVRVLQRKDPAAAPLVYGKIYGFDQPEPLKISILRTGKHIVWADTSGNFHWQPASGRYTFCARSIGYADVVTRRIKVRPGDSIEIRFRLPVGPPITCQ